MIDGVTARMLISDGNSWLPIGSRTPAYAAIEEQTASSASAGSSVAYGSWSSNVRNLNTVSLNEIGVSLSSKRVTLPVGTYFAHFHARARAAGHHQIRLYNVSAGSVIGYGVLSYAGGPSEETESRGVCGFTLNAPAEVELQHAIESAQSSNGLGGAVNDGTNVNVFSRLLLKKYGNNAPTSDSPSAVPTALALVSGEQAWDATLATNIDRLNRFYTQPMPTVTYANTGALPSAATYEGCLAVVDVAGSTPRVFISDGSSWDEMTVSTGSFPYVLLAGQTSDDQARPFELGDVSLTEVADTDGNCTVSGSKFTLASGTYEIEVVVSSQAGAGALELELYNVSSAAVAMEGLSERNDSAHGAGPFEASGMVTVLRGIFVSSGHQYAVRMRGGSGSTYDVQFPTTFTFTPNYDTIIWLEKLS
jgi:hypothetical protein